EDVAKLGISPGDPVAPVSDFQVLANNRYLAKAWDDRVGCAVMLEVMRRLQKTPHPNQVFYAATVQEEGSIEMRGAQTSSRLINPDLGFSLEVGIPNDVPGPGPDAAQEVLGGGPGIMLYTFSELPNRKLVAHVKEIAGTQHIPLQFDFVQGFGDDAGAIKLHNTGVPVTTVLVPARSTHAHNGIIDRADFDRTVDLIVALIQSLDAATVAKIKSFDQLGSRSIPRPRAGSKDLLLEKFRAAAAAGSLIPVAVSSAGVRRQILSDCHRFQSRDGTE